MKKTAIETQKSLKLLKKAEKIVKERPNDLDKVPVDEMYELIKEFQSNQKILEQKIKSLTRENRNPNASHTRDDDVCNCEFDRQFSKENYQILYENAHVAFLCVGNDGLIRKANRKAEDLTGYSRLELIGKKVFDLYADTPFGRPKAKKVFDRFTTGQLVQDEEMQIQKAGGEIFWVDLTIHPVKDDNNRIVESYSIVVDINERKLAEKAREKENERLLKLFDNMPVMLDAFDESNNIVLWNKECEKVTGYSSEEIIGNPHALDLLYPDEDYKNELFDNEAFQKMDYYDQECVITCKDGSKKTISWRDVSKQHPIAGFTYWGVGIDITERIKAEKALRDSERLHRTTINNLDEAVYVIDTDYKITLVNRYFSAKYKKRFGEVEIIGKNLFEALPMISNESREEYKEVFKTGQIVLSRGRYKNIDGSDAFFEIKRIPIMEGDRVTGVFTVGYDITKYILAENELRKSEKRLELALEGAELGWWEYDSKTGRVIRSKNWSEMLGYKPEEIESNMQSWLNLVHPEDLAKSKKTVQEYENGKTSLFKVEHRMKTKSGDWKYIYNCGKIVERDKNGKPLRAVGIHQDITKIKETELALKESLERFRLAAQSTSKLIYERDIETDHLKWYGDIDKFLGFEQNELPRTLKGWLEQIHPQDKKRIEEAVVHHRKKHELIDYEYRILRKDGSWRYWHDRGIAVLDEKGEPYRLIGACEDITDRKNIEISLERERKQLLSIFDSINDPIYIADPHSYELIYVNRTLEKLFRGKLIGKKCYKELQGFDKPCDFCTNDIILKNKGELYQWEFYNPKLKRDFLISDRIISWPGDRDVRFEIAVDITQLKKAQQELKENEEKYRIVIKKTGQLVYDYNPETGKVGWLGAIEEITGFSPDEFKKIDVNGWSEMIHADDRKYVVEKLKKAIDNCENYNAEYHFKQKNGNYIYIEANGITIKGDNGKNLRMLGTMADITRRRKGEDEIKRAYKRLNEEKKVVEKKNIAMNEILSQIENEKHMFNKKLTANINKVVIPILYKLKESGSDFQKQQIEYLENNLKDLTLPFIDKMESILSKLTPREIEITYMIRNGLSSKEISNHLGLSTSTVHKHRELIRKKLGLQNKGINLFSYLQSL